MKNNMIVVLDWKGWKADDQDEILTKVYKNAGERVS